ncbi:uncharacterized protein LOC117141677 [Drosophila mauritiana]|uniref:Uncharacterized protein LOC117141677 n=1 Tax=Drosophila mauritiana TaxID=7226 RepID=A0A6P8KAB1_DROMA|nr:uncharacterized protein LOC117141677 [Drosophila mauritiana]
MSKSKSEMFSSSDHSSKEKVAQVADLRLCGKPSYVVCRGKTSPDLAEVDSTTDLGQPNDVALRQDVQDIMKHQQNIIKLVDGVYSDIAGSKDTRIG